MRSFVFGLLAAGLLWWAWSAWNADAARAGDEDGKQPGLAELAQQVSQAEGDTARRDPVGPRADPSAEAAPEAGADPPPGVPLDSGQSPGARAAALAEGVRRGDLPSWHEALRVLAFQGETGAQERLAEAVVAGEAAAAADAVARLGDNNHFLHSEAGREAARRAVALAAKEPDPEAVALLTRLLELCMRGSIEKDDTEALDLVFEIYEEQQKPVFRHVCNPTNLSRAMSHTVARGDSLSAIASRFRRKHALHLEAGTLALVNRIHNVNAVRAGQVIKVPTDPVFTVLEKHSYLMAVYLGDVIVRLYRVGHGEDGKTPATEFRVVEKLSKPDWYAPDGNVYPFGHPKNILGSYFVKLEHPSFQGFGVHGTTQPETVGTQASMGCIRLLDADIEEFFEIVPRGSRLVIRDSR